MKRNLFLFGVLLLGLILANGNGCTTQKEDFIDIVDEGSETTGNPGILGNILVDRIKTVQGGNSPFDVTNIIFLVKSGKGYQVEASSEKSVKVEVTTDKGCLLKSQGNEYELLQPAQEGINIKITGRQVNENMNLCVVATAMEQGEANINFKITELNF